MFMLFFDETVLIFLTGLARVAEVNVLEDLSSVF